LDGRKIAEEKLNGRPMLCGNSILEISVKSCKRKFFVLLALAVRQRSSFELSLAANPTNLPACIETSATIREGRMIDLGATECIPCKMMAPILEI
jgi:thiol-disulfide isomerase/thioredoxin